MTKTKMTAALLLALLVVTAPAYGALLDIFDTYGQRQMKAAGKKNDTWYAANKELVKVKFERVSLTQMKTTCI
jgi:hypothetical protein